MAQAESARQVAKAQNNNAADHKAADIAFYKAVLASERTNGVKTNAIAALASLGVDTADWQPGDN